MRQEHPKDLWTLGDLGGKISRIGLGVGVVGLVASAGLGVMAGWDRFFQAWHVSFCYMLALSLGALFFVLIQHLTGATWSVMVRRPAEVMAANLPLLALFFIPIVLGSKSLFPWARPEVMAANAALQGKAPYLNMTFFLARWVGFFLVWRLITRFFLGASTAQDKSGDFSLTIKMERVAAPSIIAFALSLSFGAIDLLMSLTPMWYSTIFGVYYFAGAALTFFSFLAISVLYLQRNGRLLSVTPEHFHDLGKLMFAFVIFWAYIGFSQYMLIWYANIPEETTWFRDRWAGEWKAWSILLIFGHFILPFAGLISRTSKKTGAILGFWAIWMLLMEWVDIYWLAMPSKSAGKVPLHLLDLTTLLGMGGILVGVAAQRLSGHSLVPERDPRLPDSLTFENV